MLFLLGCGAPDAGTFGPDETHDAVCFVDDAGEVTECLPYQDWLNGK